MNLLVPGPELDRQVALVLNGESKGIPYSTDEAVSARLVRRLEKMGLTVVVEELDGVAYCTLSVGGERVATGSDKLRPAAIARAVVHCRFPFAYVDRIVSSRPASAVRIDSLSSPLYVSRCVECGDEVQRVRRQVTLPVTCNPCGWKNAKAKSLESSRRRPVQSP
jgi:hypothetical protein